MAGHSKWASIKHKKGANDAKRGQLFTKLIKEITVSAKLGGGDESTNPRLRTAVLKAREANMPKDNIDRAIKKGIGGLDGVNYSELTYEGYGPGGVAILIDTLTDNKNRTAAEVRSMLTKYGGNLGESGCVSYLFKKKGLITFDSAKYKEDDILETALEAGADDITTHGETIEVMTSPENYMKVLDAFTKAGFEKQMSDVSNLPDTTVTLDEEKTEKALKLIEKLEELDDVQSVSANLEIPDNFELKD
ncbi:MAG: YebC/PmpR family DNA-binding transcriptional regulator [Spirochaetaceae bacterium]|nr:YebC/PmpR family DNA-binding transcriptional regulator [Spirochaetaceae bacterium]